MLERRLGMGGLLVGLALLIGVSHISYVLFTSANYRLALYALLGLILLPASLSSRPAAAGSREPRYRDAAFVVLLCLAPWLCSLPGWLARETPFHGLQQESARVAVLGLWGWSVTLLLAQRRDIDTVLRLVLVAVLLLGVVALLEHFDLLAPSALSAGAARSSATFGNPNLLAAYLAVLLPLLAAHSLVALLRDGVGPATLAAVLPLALGILAVLSTGSRISSLVLVLCLGALLVAAAYPEGHARSRSYVIAGLAIVLGLLGLVRGFGLLPDWNLLAPYFFDNRVPVWSAAVAAFRDAPLIGHGPGSFAQSYFDFALPAARAYAVHSNSYAHSEALEVLQDGGLLAGLAWLVAWLLIGRRLRQLYLGLPARSDRLVVTGLALSLVAYLAVSFFSIATRTVSVSILFPVLLAIMCALAPRQAAESPGQAPAALRYRAVIPAALVVLLAVSAVPWFESYRELRRYQLAVERGDAAAYTAFDTQIADIDNPYLLYELMKRYLAFSDTARLAQAARKLREVAPGFRDAGFFDVMLAVSRGEMEAALEQARSFQARDRYHAENGRFLAMLAVNLGDWTMLEEQFAVLTEFVAYRARVGGIREPGQAGFRFDPAVAGAAYAPGEPAITVNPSLLLEVLSLPPAAALERLQQSFAPVDNSLDAAFVERWVKAAGFLLGKTS